MSVALGPAAQGATTPTETVCCDVARDRGPDSQALIGRFNAVLAAHRSVAVAFSGGVDSSLVLALAVRLLGRDNVVAVLGVSPSLARIEREEAHGVAAQIGALVLEVETQEMNDPNYVANGPNRCYFCKHELYSRSIGEVVARAGAQVLVNGDTADDMVRSDRPGRRAAAELEVLSPLAQAGLGKTHVRRLARELGLPVWDKPSSPCLASRIPRATPVTIGRLGAVERAELSLREMGLRHLRVRHGGKVAQVELGERELASLSDDDARARVVDAVLSSGFDEVEVAVAPLVRD